MNPLVIVVAAVVAIIVIFLVSWAVGQTRASRNAMRVARDIAQKFGYRVSFDSNGRAYFIMEERNQTPFTRGEFESFLKEIKLRDKALYKYLGVDVSFKGESNERVPAHFEVAKSVQVRSK